MRQKTWSKSTREGGPAVPELSMDGSGTRDTCRNVVDNCFIHGGGRVFAAGVGVIIGHSAFNEVTHNEICDLYYSSVSVGWVWGFGESAAHHNLIAHNHLHHLGWGVLSDMGGVYTLGPSPGTEIRHNHIHHVNSYSYGGWGLYTDEGSSGILLEDNIVHDTKDGTFHQHYGKDNTVRNNLLAFSRGTQIRRSREDLPNHILFERNLVVGDNDDMLSRVWKNGDYAVNHSLKFTDATGLRAPFFPFLEYKPRLTGGVVRGGFDVLPERGVVLSHEWRDAAEPYRTGPWLRIEADGDVTSAGKKLTVVPQGKWSRFEIVCGLGNQTTGTWDLAVTPAGGAPEKFGPLPLRSAEFRRLQWFGFVGAADAPGVFHIDNVDLGLAPAAGE